MMYTTFNESKEALQLYSFEITYKNVNSIISIYDGSLVLIYFYICVKNKIAFKSVSCRDGCLTGKAVHFHKNEVSYEKFFGVNIIFSIRGVYYLSAFQMFCVSYNKYIK